MRGRATAARRPFPPAMRMLVRRRPSGNRSAKKAQAHAIEAAPRGCAILKGDMKKAFPLIVLLLVAGLAAAYFYRAATKEGVDTGPVGSMPLMVGRDAIFVPDQAPSDDVLIGFAILSRPGFVVLHDDEEGPGRVLGASEPLAAGRHDSLLIRLADGAGEGYLYAMLHADDGDGRFDPETDEPVRDKDGALLMMRFLVSTDAEAPPEAVSF